MERGFEQFVVLGVILLAALVDLLVRWLKGKAREDQPADVTGVEDEMVLGEDEEVLVPEIETELRRQWPVEPQLPPPVAAPPPSPQPPPPTAASPRRRNRARRWMDHPADARRGIVLMTILGPCRGLEAPHGDG